MKTTVIAMKDAPKGWEKNPDYVYIGRKGRGKDGFFGNPFRLASEAQRGSTIQQFEDYARERIKADPTYQAKVKALHGKTLICFCAPRPCHGDVLAKLAAELNPAP